MSVRDKAVETLTGLGLTFLQAKVYLALAKEGKSTVKEIAKNSKVARQDLYRITPQLLDIGLVEKLVDTPTRYEGIPIQSAIDILLERRKKTIEQLEQASKEIIRFFNVNEDKLKNEESQLIVINDLQARLIKAKKQILKAKRSINIVTKWDFFATYTLSAIEEHTIAMNRGVKVKIVTHKPEEIESLPKDLLKIMKHPNFEIRYVACLPSSVFAVFDGEEANIILSSGKTPSEAGLLLTNNPSLVELAQNYFEIMWINSLNEINQQYPEKAEPQNCKLYAGPDAKKHP